MDELPPLRALLERAGLWADKRLGQHFLLDLNITRRIARCAGDLRGRAVIEVGPGPGGLTRALLEAGADPLIAIEKDARFLPLLEPLVPWSGNRLHIHIADALEIDEATLLEGQNAHIVSNLPYNVATPLMIKWFKAGAWRDSMTLMLQKEVAERVAAAPRTSAYGRLSVIAQACCAVDYAFTVPARAFTPSPKVESAVIHLEPRADAYPHLDVLERVTAAAFGQRRKMLRAALRGLAAELGTSAEDLLARANVSPTARAEEIDLAGFIALAEFVRSGT